MQRPPEKQGLSFRKCGVSKKEIKGTRINPDELVLNEKLISLNRVSKVVKGGKRMRFNALVVVGDGAGHVGIGLAKSNEVPSAIAKAGAYARKNIVKVPLKGTTIPSEATVKLGASVVFLKPASAGTGIIAGGAVRAVVEAAGVKDVLSKSLGSSNPINVAKATLYALSQLRDPHAEIARRKGIKVQTEAPVNG